MPASLGNRHPGRALGYGGPMDGFAATIEDYWGVSAATAGVVFRDEAMAVVIDPASDESQRVSIVRPVHAPTIVTVSPEVAAQLRLGESTRFSEAGILGSLADARIELHDADNLFYFTDDARADLAGEPDAPTVRRLHEGDAAEFERFQASASEQDLDDSFVELDHWAVFGSFDVDRLVAASSAYPWRDSLLADIGVLTLPGFRGRGLARHLVRALSRFAVGAGYEPQYRCQLDNPASIALAHSSGLTLFGTWQVVSPESPV